MNRTTEIKCSSSVITQAFQLPGKAIQNTDWFSEPADPTQSKGGTIQQGEIVWFDHDQFGSGPSWQQALLKDQSLVYVNPHHFAWVGDKPKI